MGRIGPSGNALSRPQPLSSEHVLTSFCCGEKTLDDWLRLRALKAQSAGSARSYGVVADGRVVGYYALAVGAIRHTAAVGRVRRNTPDPVPVMVLSRLAIDAQWQGRALGRGLLSDAVCRTAQAARIAGIRALIVHAINEDAKRFYQYFGFQVSPIDAMTLMATIAQLQAALS